ncbi:MAG: hypothetical protein ABI162_07015 [Luteolibacter sp.]
MKFLFVFPLSKSDTDAAVRSATLVKKFGPYPCDCLVYPEKGVSAASIVELLQSSFQKVLVDTPFDISPTGWPQGPNHMFKRVAKYMVDSPYDYFYFWEPDCLPVKAGWLQNLRDEYEKVAIPDGKVFMGVLHSTRMRRPDGSEFTEGMHMTGTGFYPRVVPRYAPSAVLPSTFAWDVAAQMEIVPNAHPTTQIQHDWSTGKYVSLKQLKPGVVVHHGCKDDTMYRLLAGEVDSTNFDGPGEPVGNHPEVLKKKLTEVADAPDPGVFDDVNDPAQPEEIPSMMDAVLPHAVSLLQAICRDPAAKKKIQKSLVEAGLIKRVQ